MQRCERDNQESIIKYDRRSTFGRKPFMRVFECSWLLSSKYIIFYTFKIIYTPNPRLQKTVGSVGLPSPGADSSLRGIGQQKICRLTAPQKLTASIAGKAKRRSAAGKGRQQGSSVISFSQNSSTLRWRWVQKHPKPPVGLLSCGISLELWYDPKETTSLASLNSSMIAACAIVPLLRTLSQPRWIPRPTAVFHMLSPDRVEGAKEPKELWVIVGYELWVSTIPQKSRWRGVRWLVWAKSAAQADLWTSAGPRCWLMFFHTPRLLIGHNPSRIMVVSRFDHKDYLGAAILYHSPVGWFCCLPFATPCSNSQNQVFWGYTCTVDSKSVAFPTSCATCSPSTVVLYLLYYCRFFLLQFINSLAMCLLHARITVSWPLFLAETLVDCKESKNILGAITTVDFESLSTIANSCFTSFVID